MPQQPYILTGVDVRRVSTGESRVKIINSFSAPAIKQKTIAHTHGGGVGAVNYVLPSLEAFTPSFDTFGPDLDSLAAVGLLPGVNDQWVFAGAYQVRGATRPIASRIILTATVSEIDDGQHSAAGGDKQGVKHALHNVTHYERHIDGTEWIYWDIDEMVFRVNGTDRFADQRGALGI